MNRTVVPLNLWQILYHFVAYTVSFVGCASRHIASADTVYFALAIWLKPIDDGTVC